MAKQKAMPTSTLPGLSLPGFEWVANFTAKHFEEAFEARNKLRAQLRADDPNSETAVCLDDIQTKASRLALVAYTKASIPSKFGGYFVVDGGVKS